MPAACDGLPLGIHAGSSDGGSVPNPFARTPGTPLRDATPSDDDGDGAALPAAAFFGGVSDAIH